MGTPSVVLANQRGQSGEGREIAYSTLQGMFNTTNLPIYCSILVIQKSIINGCTKIRKKIRVYIL
jgi:hypothetical protein